MVAIIQSYAYNNLLALNSKSFIFSVAYLMAYIVKIDTKYWRSVITFQTKHYRTYVRQTLPIL